MWSFERCRAGEMEEGGREPGRGEDRQREKDVGRG